jgi:TetR/AcrR family transcriptional repressor of nem operon
MQVFWSRGYEGASLPDLLDGMGLTRGSLYKAFKDKKNLFLLVLNRYEDVAVENAVTLLNNPQIADGVDRILLMFRGLVDAVEDGDHRGCLLCTAASGAAAQDADIAQAVEAGLTKMQLAFGQALKDAPNLSQMSPARRLRLANTLLTQYIGLRMLARSQLPLGVLQTAVQSVQDLLDGAAK